MIFLLFSWPLTSAVFGISVPVIFLNIAVCLCLRRALCMLAPRGCCLRGSPTGYGIYVLRTSCVFVCRYHILRICLQHTGGWCSHVGMAWYGVGTTIFQAVRGPLREAMDRNRRRAARRQNHHGLQQSRLRRRQEEQQNHQRRHRGGDWQVHRKHSVWFLCTTAVLILILCVWLVELIHQSFDSIRGGAATGRDGYVTGSEIATFTAVWLRETVRTATRLPSSVLSEPEFATPEREKVARAGGLAVVCIFSQRYATKREKLLHLSSRPIRKSDVLGFEPHVLAAPASQPFVDTVGA